MKASPFNRTLGVAATLALAGLTAAPAQAVDPTPAPSETAQATVPVAEQTQAETYQYLSAGEHKVGMKAIGTISPVVLSAIDGTEFTAPLENPVTYELVDSPENIELSVDEAGVISYRILDTSFGERTYSFKMKVTYADGSADLDDYSIVYTREEGAGVADFLDFVYSGPYHDLEVGKEYTLNPEHWTYGMTGEQVENPEGTTYEPISVSVDYLTATMVDPATGALKIKFTGGEQGDSAEIIVRAHYTDGNYSDTTITRTLGQVSSPDADSVVDFWYIGIGESDKNKEAGKEYQLFPGYYAPSVGSSDEVGIPEGVTPSLIEADPQLNATIDPATGVVTYRLDALPDGKTDYKITVRWTFPDGSYKDTSSLITFLPESSVEETPAPVEKEDSAPVAEAPATGAPEQQPAAEEKTPDNPPAQPAQEAVANGTPVEAKVNGGTVTLSAGQPVAAPVAQPAPAVSSQSQLAHTGTSHALAIFGAGLLALAGGTALVLRRFKA